ncbi:Allergen protein [Mycena indigotica]|uniref:Allergen protein n=1 Tax=Mycena indigotica TaxID=2126181 RepID=A0A8H6SNB9_9AGAR|nr:Allergen protein [Mycena indigotica]KAF7300955.1 Allergen protein [Mycena indigotica]
MRSSLTILLTLAAFALASPSGLHTDGFEKRAADDNIVYVTDANLHCMIMPRDPHTNIGDSEHPGGMKTYCSPAGKYSSLQGTLPSNFWSNVEFKTGYGRNGGRFAQLTGCIRPETLDRLNPNDGGGQYDSSGGDGGQGNPRGSVCLGYKHYVELVEPDVRRACIKCCDDPSECPLDRDQSGCPAVIQGNYFNCN